mgnify:CR=1 FL=1
MNDRSDDEATRIRPQAPDASTGTRTQVRPASETADAPTRLRDSGTTHATRMREGEHEAGEAGPPRTTGSDATVARDDASTILERTAPADRDSQALRPGAVVNQRFVVEAVIGRGGMGIVYKARDLRKVEAKDRDPWVALKVLGDRFRTDERMVVALQREARKAQTLAHPSIATVYDFDRDGDTVYLTMELLEGNSLDAFIRKHPQGVGRERALAILRGLCLGLAYAHNKNIVHSDFKPGNVFLVADDRTKILDFGIARAAPLEGAGAGETTVFDAGELGALTPSYASLEMFRGAEPHPSDDVYALAIVAYQLLTGRHPYDYAPAPDALEEKLRPRPIRGLKRREWRAIEHGLALRREDRTAHAAEFLKELEGNPAAVRAAAALLLILAGTGGYVGWSEYRAAAALQPETPFAELPVETRSAFEGLLEEGDTFRRFGDAAAALDRYSEAYDLHPRNPEAVDRIERLIDSLVERARREGSATDREVLAENVRALIEKDEFLSRHTELSTALERLAEGR